MRFTSFLAIVSLALPVLAQNGAEQDRTYYFTNPVSDAALSAAATAIRTVADIQRIDLDRPHSAVVMRATVDKLTSAEWMLQMLDRPAGSNTPTYGAAPEFRMPGKEDEAIRIFRFPDTATVPDMTAMVTSMRTIADVQRLFPYEAQKAIVARGPLDRVAAVEWLFHQLVPAPGTTVADVSADYSLPFLPRFPDNRIKIFRLHASATTADLTAMVTAIRTVADLQRLFPYEAQTAIIAAGEPENIRAAEWLIHDTQQPKPAEGAHQLQAAALSPQTGDSLVRIFYLPQAKNTGDLTPIVTRLRTEAGIQRLFPLASPQAIILRCRPDQMKLAEEIVSQAGAALE